MFTSKRIEINSIKNLFGGYELTILKIESPNIVTSFISMSGKKNAPRGKPQAKPQEVKPETKPEEDPAPKK